MTKLVWVKLKAFLGLNNRQQQNLLLNECFITLPLLSYVQIKVIVMIAGRAVVSKHRVAKGIFIFSCLIIYVYKLCFYIFRYIQYGDVIHVLYQGHHSFYQKHIFIIFMFYNQIVYLQDLNLFKYKHTQLVNVMISL